MAMLTYDTSTGQVYHETPAAVRSMLPTWTLQTRGRRTEPKNYQSRGIGSASLQETALRSCIWNIGDYKAETFEYVPWELARKIYEQLKKEDLLSFTTWRFFRTAYPEDVSPFATHISEEHGIMPTKLSSFTTVLASLTFPFLTCLSLQNLSLSRDDMMELLHIPNLSLLNLEQGIVSARHSDINDRSITTWARAANEKGSFNKLRVLLVQGFETVTPACWLANASSFPILRYLHLLYSWSSEEISPHKKLGWRVIPEKRRDNGPRDDIVQGSFDPNAIWDPIEVTTSKKMEQFHLALQTQNLVPTSDCSICINYSAGTRLRDPGMTWLTRDFDEPKKRSTEAEATSKKDEPGGKRRKVREGKQQDIGSLLGFYTS